MAPRTRNKKPNKQIKSPTHAGDDDYGRPPGTATRRAGPSRAPTQVLSERDHMPHHPNDSGVDGVKTKLSLLLPTLPVARRGYE